jgi:hypothetical protein
MLVENISKFRRGKMKKFWLILLSLGLVMAFSMSAFAVDVKVSGEFYAAGLYLNNTSVQKEWTRSSDGAIISNDSPSTAFFYQRLRIGTDFIISPSLKLVTRFDALDRIWGGQRSTPASGALSTSSAIDSADTRAENENIAVDWAYINYVSPVGTFEVGYMNYGATGTIFGNSYVPAGRIKYYSPLINNSFNINADFSKIKDQSYSAVTNTLFTDAVTDADNDVYSIEGTYTWKDGKAGLKAQYYRSAANRPLSSTPAATSTNNKSTYFQFTPYVIAKVGPVALQAELIYATGDYSDYDQPTTKQDVKLDNLGGWIDATATFAPIYVGGTFAYVSGDDPNTTDKKEGGTVSGGRDWNPCLIMFNYYDSAYWVGPISGYENSAVNGGMSNAWFFQGRIGVKPTPQLDAMLSISYATADKKPTSDGKPGATYANGTYGTEVDLTGTYKITNNLSYMLGFGYLFTGDYFKGWDTNSTISSTSIRDDFIVINKLTLNF